MADEQAGFGIDRSTAQQVFSLRCDIDEKWLSVMKTESDNLRYYWNYWQYAATVIVGSNNERKISVDGIVTENLEPLTDLTKTLHSWASERRRYMPKAAAIQYLNVCRSDKSRSKSKDCGGSLASAILPNMNVLSQVIGVLEPINQKVGQGFWFFCEGQGYMPQDPSELYDCAR